MRHLLAACLLLGSLAQSAAAVPFWGARESSPADTAPSALKPGEFVWNPNVAPAGPIAVLVSLTEQRAYVYRNGIEIGYTTVSTGKPGHETPTGIFTILQKDRNHRSSTYNNAPMPFQQRLTWDGVALHAGGLPGYPESHGCVHLPSKFAEELFAASNMGMTVVVADSRTAPLEVVHPAALAPIDAGTGAAGAAPRLAFSEGWRWQPEAAPEGPVSMLLSTADQRVIVLRNGVEIGRSRIAVKDPAQPVGTFAFIVKDGMGNGESVIARGAAARNWMAVSIPGYAGGTGLDLAAVVAGRVGFPQDFARLLYPTLVPGTTLLITDAPVLEENSGRQMTVMGEGDPNGGA
jgi:hypothetical protein